MKIRRKKEKVLIDEYKNHTEEVANRYVIKCATCALVVIFIVWILTMLNVFVIDKSLTTACFLGVVGTYLLGGLFFLLTDLSKKSIRYIILLWLVVIISIMNSTLTFHALLTSLLPIVCSTMYCTKKTSIYTYILTLISIVASVFIGVKYGICDENMLDMSNLSRVIFFVLPRGLICGGFTLVCNNISKIIMLNYSYGEKMETLAEVDGMTGLYNKSKYLSMINGKYTDVESVAVIFWDINDLKIINDTVGHDAGDELISVTATSIRNIVGPKDMAYRIGGDEFVMIIMDCNEEEVKEKLRKWNVELEAARKEFKFPISVSTGYAIGNGKNLTDIINEADKAMYENKRKWHKDKEAADEI